MIVFSYQVKDALEMI